MPDTIRKRIRSKTYGTQIVIIDAEDEALYDQHVWHVSRSFQAAAKLYVSTKIRQPNGKKKTVKLHRYLMNPGFGMVVDHRDGDTLNNSRSNLRVCTQSQNMMNSRKPSSNSTGLKGVHSTGRIDRWQAIIRINGKQIKLGFFSTPEEAHDAYCKAARELFGEFARTA